MMCRHGHKPVTPFQAIVVLMRNASGGDFEVVVSRPPPPPPSPPNESRDARDPV